MMIAVNIEDLIEKMEDLDGMNVVGEVSLKEYTTIGIGGRCKVMVEVEDTGALIACMKILHKEGTPPIDFFVLGKGSNLLVSDQGFDGIILKLGDGFNELIDTGGSLTVGAAFLLKDLTGRGVEEGWGGMEHFAGIPGTVGGAVRMNAGAWGRDIWDFVEWVNGVDLTGRDRKISRHEISPGYRNGGLDRDFIVTEIALSYERENPAELKKRYRRFMTRRKKGQEIRHPSFGSVFRNPEGFYAGKLIDSLGLRGKREGKAMISEKHANFIINLGGARASEVLALMGMMKRGVLEKYGIELESEVIFLGMTPGELEGIL
jgi:UDP-N-acetylmuramate dehydrogenase